MVGGIKKMIEDMEAGVFDKTKDGQCSNCGECCADILPVTDEEVKTIRKYIKKNGIPEQKHMLPYRTQNVIDMTCPFRDNDKKICTIYEVRPLICRDFRCDKPRKGEWAGPEMYAKEHRFLSMRQTFYWGKQK